MRDPGNSSTVSGVRDGDLVDLLARVESASEADMELDAALLNFERPELEVRGYSVWRGRSCLGSCAELLPAYTASLDASLGLVERVLPHGFIELSEQMGDPDTRANRCWIGTATNYLPDGDGWRYGGAREATAKTAPLALLAAMLKALIAQAADTSARNVPAREGQKQERSSSCASPSPPVAMRRGSNANAEPSGKEDL